MLKLLIILLFVVPVQAKSPKQLVDGFDKYVKEKDFLAARLAVISLAKKRITGRQWLQVRRTLHDEPKVGFDFVFKWDRIHPIDVKSTDFDRRFNASLAKADQLQSDAQFNEAFAIYQKLAKSLANRIRKGDEDELFLYQYCLHAMARSLYGAGRFKESLEVYQWIPTSYPRMRQVLFEKGWAAFRANRLDLANGAIASQRSSYFSDFLEPESYLIQIYIFKKLCREKDTELVRKRIRRFKKDILEEKFTYKDWARGDIETRSLLRLVEAEIRDSDPLFSKADRRRERDRIENALKRFFEFEKKRLVKQLNQVLAYSFLAIAADALAMKNYRLPSRATLLRNGQEIWPAGDGEDWIDEIGQHSYIGASLCSDQKK